MILPPLRYRQPFAMLVGDILLRRVPVALGACWSAECSQEAAQKIGYALGWTLPRIDEELEEFETERRAFLHPQAEARSPRLTQRSGGR